MNWFVRRIYADAAASMPVSRASQLRFEELSELFGNPGGVHKEAVAAKAALESARKEVADIIGAHADEIVFTSGGTEGNNLAIAGVLRPYLKSGEPAHAVTLRIEHPSVLEPLMALEDEGLSVTYMPVGEEGVASAKEIGESIQDDTALISVQMINSEIGTLQPVHDIAKEVRRARKARAASAQGDALKSLGVKASPLVFHTDASQAPLWLPLNVEKLGVDLMTLDGQKFGAPRGSGVLFVRRGVALQPLIRGGGQERGLRSGTENIALAGAFALALADAQTGAERRAKRITDVRNFLLEEIVRRIPDAILNGSPSTSLGAIRSTRIANNLNISIPGLDGQMAVVALDAIGIAASTRSACGTDDEEPSYVVASLGPAPTPTSALQYGRNTSPSSNVSAKDMMPKLVSGPARGFKKKERAQNAIRFTLLPTATYAQASRVARALAQATVLYRS